MKDKIPKQGDLFDADRKVKQEEKDDGEKGAFYTIQVRADREKVYRVDSGDE